MKTLAAALANLVAQRVLATIPYVSIQIVENHTTPTLKKYIHLSTYPIAGWESNDPAEPQLPFLRRVTFPTETMSHLPAITGGGSNTLQRRIAFSLVNAPLWGSDLYGWLTDTGRLDRANLLLQQMVLPPDEFRLLDDHHLFVDGNVSNAAQLPVPFFTGQIDRVVSVGSEIQVIGKSTLPVVDWKLVPDSGGDPRDVGLRLSVPLGAGAVVSCVNLEVGATSRVSRGFAITDTELLVEDGSGFPSSGEALVSSEKIQWASKQDDLLQGITRGEGGTSPSEHAVGESVLEVAPITLGVAGIPVSAVTDLYIRHTASGEAIRVSGLGYSVDRDDESTSPGSSGDGITTIGISSDQLVSMIHAALSSATVIQQADYSVDDLPDTLIEADDLFHADNSLVTGSSGAEGGWTGVGTLPIWTYASGSAQQGLLWTVDGSVLSALESDTLMSIQIEVELDVTALSTPIEVGIEMSGMELVLDNFNDGTLAASTVLRSTGVKTIKGTTFLARDGAHVGDLLGALLILLKGDISTHDSPSLSFKVNSMTLNYTALDDGGILDTVSLWLNYAQSYTDITDEIGSTGEWENAFDVESNGQMTQRHEDDSGGSKVSVMEFTGDPLGDDRLLTSVRILVKQYRHEYLGGSVPSSTSKFVFTGWGDMQVAAIPDVDLTLSGGLNIELDSFFLTLKAGARSGDLIGAKVEIRNDGGGSAQAGPSGLYHQPTIAMTLGFNVAGSTTVERARDSVIQAYPGGVGLEFFARCDGPVAPDNSYDASSGDLLTHPADLVRYWLRVPGGYLGNTIDATTFAAAVTNLSGYAWGFDARNLGGTWEQILLRMGYEARANICRPGEGDWQMQTADSSFQFATPTVTIDSHDAVQSIGKDDSEIMTRLVVNYAYDPRLEAADNRSCRAVQTTVPADSAVVTREEEFGRKDASPMFLLCHTAAGATGVTDWRLYMEAELGRFSRVMSCRVDHWQGYVLELGDVVTLVLVNGAVTESVKARVIEVEHNQTSGIQMRFVEVL